MQRYKPKEEGSKNTGGAAGVGLRPLKEETLDTAPDCLLGDCDTEEVTKEGRMEGRKKGKYKENKGKKSKETRMV
jgi:hypothetical protein